MNCEKLSSLSFILSNNLLESLFGKLIEDYNMAATSDTVDTLNKKSDSESTKIITSATSTPVSTTKSLVDSPLLSSDTSAHASKTHSLTNSPIISTSSTTEFNTKTITATTKKLIFSPAESVEKCSKTLLDALSLPSKFNTLKNTYRVLLIDDCPVMRVTVVLLLKKLGKMNNMTFNIDEAVHTGDGLEKFDISIHSKERYDLVIMDHNTGPAFPNGLNACKIIKNKIGGLDYPVKILGFSGDYPYRFSGKLHDKYPDNVDCGKTMEGVQLTISDLQNYDEILEKPASYSNMVSILSKIWNVQFKTTNNNTASNSVQ